MKENISKREANKSKKRESLVNTAESHFIKMGFDNASIDAIAKEAGVTKRTLYQYFESKEDLFYAVILRGIKLLIFSFEEEMKKGSNVLEKIRLGNFAYLKFYTENKDMFRLLNYKPANQHNTNTSPHYRELEILDQRRVKIYIDLITEAKSDGSINPDLDTTKAIYFAIFTSFSLLNTISTTINLWDMLGFSENEFLQFSFGLIADALK
jgi:AcrR family transcriptional regulator